MPPAHVLQHTTSGCSTPSALPGQLRPAPSGTRCSKHTSVYKVFMNNGPDIALREPTDPGECKGHLLTLALVSPRRGGTFAAVSLLQRKGHPSCWPAWCLPGNAAGGSWHPCSQEPNARAVTRTACFYQVVSQDIFMCARLGFPRQRGPKSE